MAEELTLYDYWRSSSAYRVRIALNLKGLAYRQVPVHLVREGGQQNLPSYRKLNPLGLVPALEWVTDEFEKRTGISCTFRHSALPELSNATATATYRIT